MEDSAVPRQQVSADDAEGSKHGPGPVHRPKTWQVITKRVFDSVMALVILLVALPLLASIAVAIRVTSRGPVLFRQERVTKGGRVFQMYKFRTMHVSITDNLDTTLPFFKLDIDPRLTRVGRIIRRFGLDELPQLWNVLVGDMSIVGPRPLPVDQVAANLELLGPRHAVLAGITGWWQIGGRRGQRGVTPEDAIRMDLFYIENWSLKLDVYILVKTFWGIFGRSGAY